jgi:hypothetical protein
MTLTLSLSLPELRCGDDEILCRKYLLKSDGGKILFIVMAEHTVLYPVIFFIYYNIHLSKRERKTTTMAMRREEKEGGTNDINLSIKLTKQTTFLFSSAYINSIVGTADELHKRKNFN